MEDVYRKSEMVGDSYYFASIGSLVVQYMLSFAHLPFDTIYNRPPVDIVSSCFGIVNCIVCCLLITYSAETIPTETVLSLNYLTLGLETAGSVLFFMALGTIFAANEPMYYITNSYTGYNAPMKVGMTQYFRAVSVVSFVSSLFPILSLSSQTRRVIKSLRKNQYRSRQVMEIKSGNRGGGGAGGAATCGTSTSLSSANRSWDTSETMLETVGEKDKDKDEGIEITVRRVDDNNF